MEQGELRRTGAVTSIPKTGRMRLRAGRGAWEGDGVYCGMDDSDFELVDNEKRHLARHSLARLKALAPTFAERSRQRLACVELIAEREEALAQAALSLATRRANLAIMLAVVALVVPVILFVVWTMLQPDPRLVPVRKNPPAAQSTPTPEATPEVVDEEPMPTPEPLPPSLGELPEPPSTPEPTPAPEGAATPE